MSTNGNENGGNSGQYEQWTTPPASLNNVPAANDVTPELEPASAVAGVETAATEADLMAERGEVMAQVVDRVSVVYKLVGQENGQPEKREIVLDLHELAHGHNLTA